MRSSQIPRDQVASQSLEEGYKIFLEDTHEAGLLVKKLREKNGWSLKALGERLEIDSDHLRAIETGEQPISESLAKRFSEIFHTHLHEFL